jgi:hypothetical protein
MQQPGFSFGAPFPRQPSSLPLCCHPRAPSVQLLPLRPMVLLAEPSDRPFRQRFCQSSNCRSLFLICSHCDRGQRYCSLDCRLQSRIEQVRAARRRHQQSPEGRLDHRDRQRAYRRRKADSSAGSSAISVTDHASKASLDSATIASPNDSGGAKPISQRVWRVLSEFGWLICHFCGRLGRFLNPFHEPG